MRTRYGAFFAHPGVMRLAAPAALARLSDGMIYLAVVLVIQAATGSYAVAGGGAAAYALGAGASSPVWGRTADRVGPRAIVAVTGVVHAVVLGGMFATAVRVGPASVVVGLAAAAGVARPPVGTVTRAVWSRMLPGDAREVAFTFEATVVDVVFVAGPAIVAGLAVVTAPRVALLLAAVIVLAGCVGIATAPALSVSTPGIRSRGEERRHWLGPLRHRRVLAALPVGMLAMGSIAVVEIATVGFADQAGNRAASGILLALLSVGGMIGGLCWAARRQPGTHLMQLAVLLIVLAIMWFVLSLSPGIVVLAGLLLAAGLVMNWVTTVQFATMNDLAPGGSLTEAFGWLSAAVAVGEGLGAVASGVVVDLHPDYGFWLAAVMAGASAAMTVVFLFRRNVRREEPVTDSAP